MTNYQPGNEWLADLIARGELCPGCAGLGWQFYGRYEDPPEGPCRECNGRGAP